MWIGEYRGDAANIAANVSDVQLAMGELRRSPTQANINQLGSMAQTASDGVSRSDGIGSSAVGMLGVAERHVVLGGGLLEGALHAIVAYMDDPGPAALARMTRRYDHAVAEWNSAVRTVWRLAHSARPPIV